MAKIQKSQGYLKRPPSYSISVTQSHRSLPLSDQAIECLLKALCTHFDVKCQTVAVHYISKNQICALHKEHFDDASPTDCITFPFDHPREENGFLGEIFVCPTVAKAYSKNHDLDPYRELTLYTLHGFLHLLGLEDKTQEGVRKMRREEKKTLAWLEKQDLLLK